MEIFYLPVGILLVSALFFLLYRVEKKGWAALLSWADKRDGGSGSIGGGFPALNAMHTQTVAVITFCVGIVFLIYSLVVYLKLDPYVFAYLRFLGIEPY